MAEIYKDPSGGLSLVNPEGEILHVVTHVGRVLGIDGSAIHRPGGEYTAGENVALRLEVPPEMGDDLLFVRRKRLGPVVLGATVKKTRGQDG